MKKITIYELLGMAKDGKAPSKIKYDYHYYIYDERDNTYYQEMSGGNILRFTVNDINDEVEILEEEKKIPEKITINDNGTIGFPNGQWTARNMDKAFAIKINEIIDYFEYLKSKGDE